MATVSACVQSKVESFVGLSWTMESWQIDNRGSRILFISITSVSWKYQGKELWIAVVLMWCNITGPYFHCCFALCWFSTRRFSIIFQDDEHIVQCCTEATPSTFHSTHELLNYARSRVTASSEAHSDCK